MGNLSILGIISEGLQIAGSLFGIVGEAKQKNQKADEDRLRGMYRESLWSLNEQSIKASYHRNVRANMMSESISLGRQASALASANIGVAGTSVPAFGAVMARTDFDNQGYELNKMHQLGELSINRSQNKRGMSNIESWGSSLDWINAGLRVGNTVGNVINENLKKREK